MKLAACYNDQGRYTWVGTISPTQGAPSMQGNFYIGLVDPLTQYHDLDSGQPVTMPTRPSPDHNFDFIERQWVLDVSAAWARVRMRRDGLLAHSDWMVIKAMDTGAALAPAWAAYRQALRDITLQADPQAIVWPSPPA